MCIHIVLKKGFNPHKKSSIFASKASYARSLFLLDQVSIAGRVVPGVERVPASVQIGFEPSCEVARRERGGGAYIAEISGAVAGRNVHAAAKRDGEMGIVAANADAFLERVLRSTRDPRRLVVERDVTVHVVANRLHTRVAWRSVAE